MKHFEENFGKPSVRGKVNQMGKPCPSYTSNFLEREKYHLPPCLMIQFGLENEAVGITKIFMN